MEKKLYRIFFNKDHREQVIRAILIKIGRVLPGMGVHGSAPGGACPSLNSPKAGATTLEAMPKLVEVQMNLFKTFLNLGSSV